MLKLCAIQFSSRIHWGHSFPLYKFIMHDTIKVIDISNSVFIGVLLFLRNNLKENAEVIRYPLAPGIFLKLFILLFSYFRSPMNTGVIPPHSSVIPLQNIWRVGSVKTIYWNKKITMLKFVQMSHLSKS